MTIEKAHRKSRAGVEDILLALLGIISGPLLWWMAQSWKAQPAASSLHTLEYWIALICGVVGAALATVWMIFLVAGMAFVIGLKTRHAALTTWAALFTPKFLRRILISVLGAQLALSSQAVAGPQQEDTPPASPSTTEQGAFMPYVETPIAQDPLTLDERPSVQTTSPVPAPRGLSSSSGVPTESTSSPPLSPKPRETSQVTVFPEPVSTQSSDAQLVPTPRQTSMIAVETEPLRPKVSQSHSEHEQSGQYTPPPVPLSPRISAPPSGEDTIQKTLVVKTGDCLWDIAHYELGADATLVQIDRRWRQWWRHNHRELGDDPHTIQPGTTLKVPPFTD